MISVVPCLEPPEEYDAHKVENQKIAESFENSKSTFEIDMSKNLLQITDRHILHSADYEKVPYGPNTTLGESGCAVFCLQHGLAIKGIDVPIAKLAAELADKGYYEKGKGTYHSLFDRYKNGFCTRCSLCQDIVDSLLRGKMVTCLVDNSKYHKDSSRTGAHYINLVGKQGRYFLVEDSHISWTDIKSIETIINATMIAWSWN